MVLALASRLPRALVGVNPAAAERALGALEATYASLRETRQTELVARTRELEEEAALVHALETEVEAEGRRVRQEMQRVEGYLSAVRDRVERARGPMDGEEARAAGRISDLEVRLGQLYAAGDEFRKGLREVLTRTRRFEAGDDGEAPAPPAVIQAEDSDPSEERPAPVGIQVSWGRTGR